MAKTPKTEPTIAELAAKATTSDQLAEVVSRLDAEIEAAENELEALEASRKDVVFSGKTLDEYHSELNGAVEKIKTLSAGIGEARNRYEATLAKEATQNLVERTEAIRAGDAPALTEAYLRLYNAMKNVIAVSAEVEAIGRKVEDHNSLVERKGRTDLMVRIGTLRADVYRQLGIDRKLAEPVTRMEGESEEGFALRQANAQARTTNTGMKGDPVQATGLEAMIAIQRVAMDMGAHERERNLRLVSVQKYQMPDGHIVEKFVDSDPAYKNRHHKMHVDGIDTGLGEPGMLRGTASAVA